MSQCRAVRRKKTRSFHGNRFVKLDVTLGNTFNEEEVSSTPTTSGNTQFSSVSGRKLSSNPIQDSSPSTFKSPDGKDHSVTGYRSMEILPDIISSTLCPECKIRNLELEEVMSKKQRSSSSLVVLSDCG